MKKKLVSLALALVMCMMLCVPALAAEVSRENAEPDIAVSTIFSEEFLSAMRISDGAASYAFEADIFAAYESNPDAFLAGMASLTDADKDQVSSYLIIAMYYDGNWQEFKTFLSEKSSQNEQAAFLLQLTKQQEAEELEWEEAYQNFLAQPEPEGLFSPTI